MRFGIREFVLLLVLLAVPLSSYWLVFKPQNEEIAQAKREIEMKRQMLSKIQVTTARNEDLAAENERIAESIAAIEARLPTSNEVDNIVRQVSPIAVDAGLEPPSIKSLKPLRAAMYMELPLEMETEGDFHGFYRFLLELEQLPRITRMPDLKLKRADDEGTIDASFTLSIYFEDEEQAP